MDRLRTNKETNIPLLNKMGFFEMLLFRKTDSVYQGIAANEFYYGEMQFHPRVVKVYSSRKSCNRCNLIKEIWSWRSRQGKLLFLTFQEMLRFRCLKGSAGFDILNDPITFY